ncbi:MAG: GxxExxY protein [Saprospiraceae bacterium]|nr:GxxExxY protein [Saprospiraceae bacterium]
MERLNDLSYIVRKAVFNVHNELGPGLFESVYEAAMLIELELLGLKAESQKDVKAMYKNRDLGLGFRIDILVDDELIVEIKSVETLSNTHKKQLLTYLRLTKKKLGILVNFNDESIIDKESIIRIINTKQHKKSE